MTFDEMEKDPERWNHYLESDGRLPMPNKEDVEKFRHIYQRRTGVWLEPSEAEEAARRVLHFYYLRSLFIWDPLYSLIVKVERLSATCKFAEPRTFKIKRSH